LLKNIVDESKKLHMLVELIGSVDIAQSIAASGGEIEFLAIGNCILRKDQQNPGLAKDYKSAFEPD
jgi:hypothetical protein